jgi:hypothetical protein
VHSARDTRYIAHWSSQADYGASWIGKLGEIEMEKEREREKEREQEIE